MVTKSRLLLALNKAQLLLAFVLAGSSVALHLREVLSGSATALKIAAILNYTAPLLAILFVLILIQKFRRTSFATLIVCFVFFCATLICELSAIPRTVHLATLLFALFLMLIFLRVGALPYAILAVGSGTLVGLSMESILVGVGAAAGFGGLIFIANYLVQLVLDHQHEWRRLKSLFANLPRKKIAALAFILWLPSAALVLAGLVINWQIQTRLVEALYAGKLIDLAPADYTDPSGRTGIEKDTYFTIDSREKRTQERFNADLTAAQANGDHKLSQFPGIFSSVLEVARPPQIDRYKACKGANVPIRILGKKLNIGFKTICRSMIGSIEAMIMASYERNRRAAELFASDEIKKIRQAGADGVSAISTIGSNAIHKTYENYRNLAGVVFTLLLVLSLISYVLLATALIGSFNIVLGRLLFDANLKVRDDTNSLLATFRLDPQPGDAIPLKYSLSDEINLKKISQDHEGVNSWFVSLDAMRVGAGAHMCLSLPCPIFSIPQRLVSRRYFMSRIDVASKAVRQAPDAHAPVISMKGDLKLVCIEIVEGQEVVFHVGQLLAFTNGVRLQSIYTAHLSTHLVGLGSFYSIARGSGFLVLVPEGADVMKVSKGLAAPPATLLAWDRRTEFRLAQETSVMGIWLNEPSVVSESVRGAVILDQGAGGKTGLLGRLWHLFRYLFMPF
ncbi:hypothetical protein [Asticcacaulis sp. AC460]|uniref:hypothetical protein n=1 Tax=Asticcacaulis sp. AC460 TaxID=1282360 RepID=UPI0012DD9884|nr:hypothetical protein [Asticcacaulis sp. AC460]